MSRHVCPWPLGKLLSHLEPKARTVAHVHPDDLKGAPSAVTVRVRHDGVWSEHEAVVRGTYGRIKSMTVDVG